MDKIRIFLHKYPQGRWVLFLPIYLILFFFIESVVPAEGYWATQLPIDWQIPFWEGFVVFYSSWAPVLIVTGLWLLFRDSDNFRDYMKTLSITFFSSTFFCLLVPNGQDLRPAVMPRDNLFCSWVELIYSLDTNTNVLPSVHVVGVMAFLFALWHTSSLKKWRLPGLFLGILIIFSTLFIKQHAVLDVAASFLLSLSAYFIVYHRKTQGRPYVNL